MKSRQKQQFNIRLDPLITAHAASVCDALGWTRTEITEVALASMFGSRDSLVVAKLEKIKAASKQMGAKLPFDRPATPFKNNALTC